MFQFAKQLLVKVESKAIISQIFRMDVDAYVQGLEM